MSQFTSVFKNQLFHLPKTKLQHLSNRNKLPILLKRLLFSLTPSVLKTHCCNKLTLIVFSRYSRRKMKFKKSRPSNYYLNHHIVLKGQLRRQAVCFLSQLMTQTLVFLTAIHPISPCVHTRKRSY